MIEIANQECTIMKSFKEKIEAILTAVTFAEAGEHETALAFLQDSQRAEEASEKTLDWKGITRSAKKATVREKLQNHFVAATFAEAGEFETARQILPAYERKQTVLLAIEGGIPTKATFDYAVSLCTRMNANLDILQILSQSGSDGDGPSESLAALLPGLEGKGVSFNVTVRKAKAIEILYDYVRTSKNVVTAVIDSPTLRDRETADISWKEALRNVAERISIPLVTVSEREPSEVPIRLR
jgi:hypothetical protein